MSWRGWTCQGKKTNSQYAIVALGNSPRVVNDKEVPAYLEQGYRTVGTGWHTRAEAEAAAGIPQRQSGKKKREK